MPKAQAIQINWQFTGSAGIMQVEHTADCFGGAWLKSPLSTEVDSMVIEGDRDSKFRKLKMADGRHKLQIVKWPYLNKQETQLSQRDRSTLRVIA